MVVLYWRHQFMKTTSRTQLVLVTAWLLALALNLTFAALRPGGTATRVGASACSCHTGHGMSRPDAVQRSPIAAVAREEALGA